MTTIQIAYEVSDKAFSEIMAHLDYVALHDVNWNGADFNVERDDFTCIPEDNSAAACTLLYQIQKIISGE